MTDLFKPKVPDLPLFKITDAGGVDWGLWPGQTAIEAGDALLKHIAENPKQYLGAPLTKDGFRIRPA